MMKNTTLKIIIVLAILTISTPALADLSDLTWGSFDPDKAFKAVAELPRYILILVRWVFIFVALITVAFLFWQLGSTGRRQLGNLQQPNKINISFGQFVIGILLAVLLWSFAESLTIVQISKGILEGSGVTNIEHPLGHIEASQKDYGWVLFKVFVLNGVNLIGFVFIAGALYTWQQINLGYSQETLKGQMLKMFAGILFMSFEWTYYFVASTLEFGDPLGILFE